MSSATVEIYVPSIGKSFETNIPMDMKIMEAIPLVSKLVQDLASRAFLPDENAVLCDRDSGAILNINVSVRELGIKNGSRLMLI